MNNQTITLVQETTFAQTAELAAQWRVIVNFCWDSLLRQSKTRKSLVNRWESFYLKPSKQFPQSENMSNVKSTSCQWPASRVHYFVSWSIFEPVKGTQVNKAISSQLYICHSVSCVVEMVIDKTRGKALKQWAACDFSTSNTPVDPWCQSESNVSTCWFCLVA